MVKLFRKNSNLCDHNSPTLQTDRQTTCDRNTALCTKVHRAVKTMKARINFVKEMSFQSGVKGRGRGRGLQIPTLEKLIICYCQLSEITINQTREIMYIQYDQ